MRFGYPISLDLVRRRAVVIGETAVAQGKVEGLLAAGAEVTVVATGPQDFLAVLEWEPSVTVLQRAYRPGDLAGASCAWRPRSTPTSGGPSSTRPASRACC